MPSKSLGIRREKVGIWEWFKRGEPPYEITGKYLFFSTDRDRLVEIAVEELRSGGFHRAKIPIEGRNLSPEYVLCLYYANDEKKHELAIKYGHHAELKYRYWKSDRATMAGEYSQRFIDQLPANLRPAFTKKKQ